MLTVYACVVVSWAVTVIVTAFLPVDRSTWCPSAVSESAGVIATIALLSVVVAATVAVVTVLATPTSYEVRFAANPMMSLGETVRALSVVSVLRG